MLILGRSNSLQYRLTSDERSGHIIVKTPKYLAILPITCLMPLCVISITFDKKFILLSVKITSGGIK